MGTATLGRLSRYGMARNLVCGTEPRFCLFSRRTPVSSLMGVSSIKVRQTDAVRRKLVSALRVVFNADYRFIQRFAPAAGLGGVAMCLAVPAVEAALLDLPPAWGAALVSAILFAPLVLYPRKTPFAWYHKLYWEFALTAGVAWYPTIGSLLGNQQIAFSEELAFAAALSASLTKPYGFFLGFPVFSVAAFFWAHRVHPEISYPLLDYQHDLMQAVQYGIVIQVMRTSLERFYLRMIDTEKHVARLEAEKQVGMLRLSSLRAKSDPHFLFNTLTSICSLHRNDPGKTEHALLSLSHLFRYILEAGDATTVPLDQELSIVRSYLDLERLRFGEKLQYRIDVNGAVEHIRIPALTIQPLVENAVKHGFGPRGGEGTVEVTVEASDQEATIRVADNGIGFPEPQPDTGHGLSIVKQRLQLLCGERFSMEQSVSPAGGALVEIRVPAALAAAV
ncbi:MAG: hypothetical protein GF331_27325 [Chitinivibrionales bacterium]|nr:hypothetical protein [Chitinivibrionales bacterium]